MATNKAVPTKVIDLHGMVAALRTTNNAVRVAVIDAIQSGDMQIVRSVSDDLKAAYPAEYKSFQSISPKKYMHIRVAHEAAAGVLSENYGASPFGGIPLPERFEVMALCAKEGVDLVTSGKCRRDCAAISKKCALNGTKVLDITDLP